jgi:CubicO group peptidase (beta-lactamase class C family)
MKAPAFGVLVLALPIVASSFFPAVAAKPPDIDFAALATRIEKVRTENNIPSFSVAVSRRGKIIWERGFGWADVEGRVPATPHTVYAIASISKPITATGLMILVERDKVKLDAPINTYLSSNGLRARIGDADQATVRRVLQHNAGLPLHSDFVFPGDPRKEASLEDAIKLHGYLFSLPGERFQYSNLGYGILAQVIAQKSAQSFAEFLESSVFAKLGMAHTSVYLAPHLKRYEAKRYLSNGKVLPPLAMDTPGAGGIYSSADDLIKFAMFHLKDHLADQDKILSDTAIEAMQVVAQKDGKAGDLPDARGEYGLGWRVRVQSDGHTVVSHLGGMPGVRTALELVTDEDVAVVVLSNLGTGGTITSPVLSVRDEILKAVLSEWKPPHSNVEPLSQSLDALVGIWRGTIHTNAGQEALAMRVVKSGQVSAAIGTGAFVEVSGPAYRNGWLEGAFAGKLNASDLRWRKNYNIGLSLKLRGGVLSGAATAESQDDRGFELTYWAELRRESAVQQR